MAWASAPAGRRGVRGRRQQLPRQHGACRRRAAAPQYGRARSGQHRPDRRRAAGGAGDRGLRQDGGALARQGHGSRPLGGRRRHLQRPQPTYPHGFPPAIIAAFSRAIGRGLLGNRRRPAPRSSPNWATNTCTRVAHRLHLGRFGVPAGGARQPGPAGGDLSVVSARARPAAGRARRRPGDRPPLRRPAGRLRAHRRPSQLALAAPPARRCSTTCRRRLTVAAVGKIDDIFGGRGITARRHTHTNMESVNATLAYLAEMGPGCCSST